MASEAEEVAALDRILTRTVLTKDEDLAQLLAKLLPALVLKMSTQQPKTRAKVLELLNHINKRVKALPGVVLPLLPLAQAAASPPAGAGGALVSSLGLLYLELGIARAPAQQQLDTVPLLLNGLSQRPAQQRSTALRVVTAALSQLQPAPGGSYSQVTVPGSSSSIDALSLLPAAPADRQLLLEHALKLLLYQRPNSSNRPAAPTALGLANAAAAGGEAAAAAAVPPPPPAGLSTADVAVFEEKGAPEQEQLSKQKLGMLCLLAAAAAGMPGNAAAAAPAAAATASGSAAAAARNGASGASQAAAMEVDGQQQQAANGGSSSAGGFLSSEELLLPLLAASCDPYEAVSRRGSDLLLKVVNPDAARPSVDLERPAVVAALMALLLGDQDPRAAAGGAGSAPAAAGPALALRIMGLLVRSVAAARCFPEAVLVLQACFSGPSSSPRLVRLGAQWAGWLFKHAERHQLRAMAGPVMQRLLEMLGLPDAAAAAAAGGGGGEQEGDDGMQVDGSPAAAAAAAAGGGSGSAALLGVSSAVAGAAEARGYAFSALAQLTQRLPELFQGNTQLAAVLFSALAVEPPGSRASLQEALQGLAAALAAAVGKTGSSGISSSAADATAEATARAAAAAAAAAGGSGMTADQLAELEGLLLRNITSDQAAVRLAAAQWAARLFPRTHMPSRYVCLLAAGDVKPELRDVGRSGLGLAAPSLTQGAGPSAFRAAVSGLGLPPPGAVIAHLGQQHRSLAADSADLGRPLPLPDASCQALIAFTRAAATAAGAAATSATADSSGYSLLSHALLLEGLAVRAAGRDTAAAALEGLVELAGASADWIRAPAPGAAAGGAAGQQQRELWQREAAALRERYAGRSAWVGSWLGHSHGPVRLAAARLAALAAAPGPAAEALAGQLLGSFPPLEAGAAASSSSKLEEQEGAMLAAGLLVARANCTTSAAGCPDLISLQQQQDIVAALTAQLRHHCSGIASTSTGPGGGSSSEGGGGSAGATRNLTLAGAAAAALGFAGLTRPVLPDGEEDGSSSSSNGSSSSKPAPPPPDSVLGLLLRLAGGRDNRAALRAVAAVGYIASGSSSAQLRLAATAGLLQLGCVKGSSEELLLGIGEAAVAAAGAVAGARGCRDLLLWSNLDSLADCVDATLGPAATPDDAAGAGAAGAGSAAAVGPAAAAGDSMEVDGAPPAAAVDSAAASSPAAAAAAAEVQGFLLAELADSMAKSPKEETRCAAVLVLVSLLQLVRSSPLLAARLAQLQAAFTALLGDTNELTQDLAAAGVSLVYSRGGPALQQQLLGQLVALLQGGAAAAAAAGVGAAGGVKVSGDSRLFEEGQLGAAPGGGGITSYRELCSLANELGQPDLIYRFMDLSRASSALSAKRGAAVGVARIARLAAAATGQAGPGGAGGLAGLLGPQRLAALLPKLYRLTHDPSPKVAEAMGSIWAALLDDPRAATDTHFDAIVTQLLADAGARLWRVRQSAAAALTDLLAGRRWGQLAPHMEQLWVMALRGVDDVKESVRAAAAGLLRSLRGISLRVMDLSQTPAADVSACCRVVLPLLCGSQGLGSSVEVVRGVAADVVCSSIKSAGPAQVLPVLPGIVPVLLEALSGFEDARLNYVEQHAEAIGVDAERLAAARLAAARSSAISEALDAACRSLTGPAASELAPALAAVVRRGVGLNTKVGTARFIRALAARLGTDLRPQQPDAKPAAPLLLKPLVAAVAAESSSSVKRAYAAAAAALVVRCVGEKRRDAFVTAALDSYGAAALAIQPFHPGAAAAAGGSGDAAVAMAVDESPSRDDASRQAGGLLLRELLKESSDTFAAHASQILPVAFLASHDESPAVAAAWGAVWSEGCPSEPAALRLHTPELAALLAGGLSSSSWGKKKGAAQALVVLAGVAAPQLSPYSPGLISLLLPEASAGGLWEGKELLLAATGQLAAACAPTLAAKPGQLPALLSGLLSAAARKKTAFRAAALTALQKVLTSLQPLVAAPSSSGTSGGTAAAVDAAEVWELVSPPLLTALEQQAAAATAAPGTSAGAGGSTTAAADADERGGDGAAADEAKPLPLVETCGCLSALWQLLPPQQQAAAAPGLVSLLAQLLQAPGLPWTAWLAVVGLSAELISSCSSGVAAAAVVPLAAGLVHVLQHSNVSQLRVKCLEALLKLLQAAAADATAAAAFKQAAGPSGSSLASVVSGSLVSVAAQDPSAAHRALAAQATGVLKGITG